MSNSNDTVDHSDIGIVQQLVYQIRVAEVMTHDVITVTPQTPMAELARVLQEHQISGTPVVEAGNLVGIISVEDLIKALAAGEMSATVGEKMTREPIALHPDQPVVQAFNYFTNYRFGRFPVLDGERRLVGILTRSNIIQGLLKKLEIEFHEEQIRHYRASHVFEDIVSDRTSIHLTYGVAAGDFAHAGEASGKIKLVLTRLGVPPDIIRRAAIASYEAEMNVIIHTIEGGEMTVEILPKQLVIRTVDNGPGISDIDQAMEPGYSTAPEWIRELGFGAGMGLSNIRRCADQMRLESSPGNGTRLEAMIWLTRKDKP
ncbi:MAG: CBS domain-containing protein [Chloroflexi bacterium]|nr:CBS domain-containing protein [Chloroflexota bacterium]